MAAFITRSPGETAALGRRLAAALPGGALIAFTGGLGAGKTAFCRGLAEGLGCTDAAASPTFSIVNVYRGPRLLAHFDLYRITSPEDLEAAGLFDYLAQGAIVAVEWSELADGWFAGEKAVQVDIRQGAAEDERIITIEGAGL